MVSLRKSIIELVSEIFDASVGSFKIGFVVGIFSAFRAFYKFLSVTEDFGVVVVVRMFEETTLVS